MVLPEEAEGDWKKGASWERAMKKVRTDLRASMRNWKGRSGEWVVRERRRGLRSLARRGGW